MEPTSEYRIDSSRGGTWIDRYYRLVGLPIFAVIFLSGLISLLLGCAIAFAYGFQRHFFGTSTVYLGAFGVGWVSAWIRWGMLKFPDQLDYNRSGFVIDDDAYQALTDRWLRRLRNNRQALTDRWLRRLRNNRAALAVSLVVAL